MATTITYMTPIKAMRGIEGVGTAITIVGTGFGASQGTGGVTIGGTAAAIKASGGWSDTQIICYAAASTPVGSADVVVTTDGASATATETNGVYVYDETDNDDNTEILTGKVADLFINGLAVGYLRGASTFGPPAERLLPHTPQDKQTPNLWRILEKSIPVQVVLSQINGANLAAATGGTYNETSRILEIAATEADKAEYDVLIVLTNGMIIACPRCLISGLAQIVMNVEDWQGLPLSITAIPVDDADAIVAKIYVP